MGRKAYTELMKEIVEYIEKKGSATTNEVLRDVFKQYYNIVANVLLAFLVYEDVLEYKNYGRARVFRVKNKEKLNEVIKKWEEKVWL